MENGEWQNKRERRVKNASPCRIEQGNDSRPRTGRDLRSIYEKNGYMVYVLCSRVDPPPLNPAEEEGRKFCFQIYLVRSIF